MRTRSQRRRALAAMTSTARLRAAALRRRDPALSLDLDGSACFLELLLDALRFVLRHAFLDGARHTLDEVLGFLEAQARDGADDLDDRDLVVPKGGHDNVELGLFLGGQIGRAS